MAARKRRAKTIGIRVTEDEYEALQAEANEQEVNVTDVLRREVERVTRKWREAGIIGPQARRLREEVMAELAEDGDET